VPDLLRQAKSPRIEKRRVSQKCIGQARPFLDLAPLAAGYRKAMSLRSFSQRLRGEVKER
jgi:hypothetical protein